MPTGGGAMLIRRARPEETDAVRALVQRVVDGTYGGLWAPPPVPIGDDDWSRSWVAVTAGHLAGMVLTAEEWIDDLWVLREHQGQGIGRALLRQGEAEIAARGHSILRLRVVKANAAAIAFYGHFGWRAHREVPHDSLPITFIEMVKAPARPQPHPPGVAVPGCTAARSV